MPICSPANRRPRSCRPWSPSRPPEDASTPQPPRGAPLPPLAYGFVDEDTLRSLPVALAPSTAATAPPRPAHRSVYDPQGLIPGSERLERFFFWPMGIRSAGQMRQWGRHATAFVGRRHFDDPRLLDRYFTLSIDPDSPQ